MHRLLIILTILTVFIADPALAQQAPPGRAGRVSFVSGNLAFHTAGQTEWSAAAVNYPVAIGASLWTDAEARAEIRIGPDTVAMAGNTELDAVALDERVTRFEVPQGRVYLHLRRLDQGQSVEIDIPRGAVQLLQPGYYDIDAGTQDQPARIAVFGGSARFVGSGADIAVKTGDVAVLNGISPVAATFEPAVADAFVEWSRSRDYDEKRLAAPYHVSPNMTGHVELDANGRWDTAPGYDEVWYPDVSTGWVPYTDGRWVWVAPWGWTWIDAAPWGFAPCHYGRWAFIGERWGWVPGTFEPSPVYAPALVAFLGGAGAGLYVSGAVGPQVGWFPLAPGETYWPSYTAEPSYIRRLNQANVGSIDDVQIMRNVMLPAQVGNAQFANRRFATVAPQHVFAGARQIVPAAHHVPAAVLEHASVTMRPPQVRPSPARAVPGPAGFGARGQSSPMVGTQGEHIGGAGRLTAPSYAAALPPHPETAVGGHQPGRPTSSAALPRPGRPREASAHSGMASPPSQSSTGQHDHPTWSGATHPRAPAQAFRAPAEAPHPPGPAPHPRAEPSHPPTQAWHAPGPAPHPQAEPPHPPGAGVARAGAGTAPAGRTASPAGAGVARAGAGTPPTGPGTTAGGARAAGG